MQTNKWSSKKVRRGGGGPGALTAEVQHLERLGNSDIFGNIW